MIPALILFALTYVFIIAFPKYRTYIALCSGILFIITGMLSFNSIIDAIDFNVLLMIAGSMGLVQLFIDSKMPDLWRQLRLRFLRESSLHLLTTLLQFL